MCDCLLWCYPAPNVQDRVMCGRFSEATAVLKGVLIVQDLLRSHVRVAICCGGMQLYFHSAAFLGILGHLGQGSHVLVGSL